MSTESWAFSAEVSHYFSAESAESPMNATRPQQVYPLQSW
jgi:hypothetical protein